MLTDLPYQNMRIYTEEEIEASKRKANRQHFHEYYGKPPKDDNELLYFYGEQHPRKMPRGTFWL